jgi:hypothetical protein
MVRDLLALGLALALAVLSYHMGRADTNLGWMEACATVLADPSDCNAVVEWQYRGGLGWREAVGDGS